MFISIKKYQVVHIDQTHLSTLDTTQANSTQHTNKLTAIMERVRSGKAVHVPVPAPLAPVLLSRDERQQLRLAKHRAFQRHQQNAMWTRSVFVFDGVTHRLSSSDDESNNSSNNNNSSSNVDDSSDSAERPAAANVSSDNAVATTDAAEQQQQSAADESRLRDQIDAKAREIATAKQQIARVEQEQRENQARYVCVCQTAGEWYRYKQLTYAFVVMLHSFEELVAGLKAIADSAALTSFHERVEQERVRLLPTPVRDLEVVKL